ncbi:MAG TPA: ferritin-like domain-containing protein [Kiloniellales bacterium]|nr:ferritin-like domain-containing protein [Kiloniellales bacterium]
MTDPKDHLIAWLKDAHAAEEQAIVMLEKFAGRLENYPQLKARVEEHVGETRSQAERIRSCLQRHDSDASGLKDMGTKLMGFFQGLSGVFTDDEVIKGMLASYAFEHMEIASYRILVSAARTLGDPETARVCEDILQEEIAMARWLEDNLDGTVEKFFALERSGGTARH